MPKKIIKIITALIFSFNYVYSQAPPIEWQKCYGSICDENSFCIEKTSDGGSISCGSSYSCGGLPNGDVTTNHGAEDIWVIKLDAAGTLMWERSLGGNGVDRGFSIEQTSDGGYIVAGFTSSNNTGDVGNNHGSNDYWIVKLTNTGAVSWQKTYGGTGLDNANCIHETTDGNYIVAGVSNSSDGDITGTHGAGDCWILKLDIAGNIIWQRAFGGTGYDEATSIKETTDGGYIFSGNTRSSDGDVTNPGGLGKIWIVKLTNAANIEWQKVYGSNSGGDGSYGIFQTNDGGYAVLGDCYANSGDVTGNHGFNDFWVFKIDNIGNLIWQKSLGGSGFDAPRSLIQCADGGIVASGITKSNDGDATGNPNHGYWICKLSSTGSLLWQKAVGGNGNEQSLGSCQSNDGGYLLTGYTNANNMGDVGPSHGLNDFWIVKLAPDVVPITLTAFDAIAKGKDVFCSWQTQQEQNSSHFIVERSNDALHFISVGNVPAKGNSVIPIVYNFVDGNAFVNGKEYLYYRLKIVDLDGSYKYSNAVKVKAKQLLTLIVSPNPAIDYLNLSFVSAISEQANAIIYDAAGKKVYQQAIAVNAGANTKQINISSLPAGNYTLSVNGKNNEYRSRFIKANW